MYGLLNCQLLPGKRHERVKFVWEGNRSKQIVVEDQKGLQR